MQTKVWHGLVSAGRICADGNFRQRFIWPLFFDISMELAGVSRRWIEVLDSWQVL